MAGGFDRPGRAFALYAAPPRLERVRRKNSLPKNRLDDMMI
jgi:hypothetical protein